MIAPLQKLSAILLLPLSLLSTPPQARASAGLPPIQLAITVDDLPEHSDLVKGWSRQKILDAFLAAFKKYKIKGVYGFVNSQPVAEYNPQEIEILKQWQDAGHKLGNHTYSHPDFAETSLKEYEREILKNETFLKKPELHGEVTADEYHYFRFPFLSEGDTLEKRDGLRHFLADHHYTIAPVSVDFEDWIWNEEYPSCERIKRKKDRKQQIQWLKEQFLLEAKNQLQFSTEAAQTVFARPIKHIVLMHFGIFDALMLDELFKMWTDMGVEFITLQEALKDPAYSEDDHFVSKDGMNLMDQMLELHPTLPRPNVLPFDTQKVSNHCR